MAPPCIYDCARASRVASGAVSVLQSHPCPQARTRCTASIQLDAGHRQDGVALIGRSAVGREVGEFPFRWRGICQVQFLPPPPRLCAPEAQCSARSRVTAGSGPLGPRPSEAGAIALTVGRNAYTRGLRSTGFSPTNATREARGRNFGDRRHAAALARARETKC